jgi:hypothetical protein
MMPEQTSGDLRDMPSGEAPGRRLRIWRYCFALFTLEIGLFLLIYPWTDRWLFNDLQDYSPWLNDLWQDQYFQGALSGLGGVNVYLAVQDLLRTLRGA